MNFSVFVPDSEQGTTFPALYFLAGLTCTEETFMIKAGAQRIAAAHGLILVTCDTSPRGLCIPGDSDSWDFGVGAGFYVDASRDPWRANYQMFGYVNSELPVLVERHFPAEKGLRGIMGHSMGGHGALISAFRNPNRWKSVSAIAPICNPSVVPWGQKAFTSYLGPDVTSWKEWDACELVRIRKRADTILVDQGEADQFLNVQLRPELLQEAAATSGRA